MVKIEHYGDGEPRVVVAKTISREPGVMAPVVARLDEQITAVLLEEPMTESGKGGLKVVDLTGRELYDDEDNYWRSFMRWEDLGGPAPLLLNLSFPGSFGIWSFGANVYSPDSGRLETVTWRFPDSTESTGVSGDTGIPDTGPLVDGPHFTFCQFTRYPARYYAFRWKDGVLVSDTFTEEYIADEEKFAQLVLSPVLSVDDWERIFADPALGRKAFEMAHDGDGWNKFWMDTVERDPYGYWNVIGSDGRAAIEFLLDRTEKDRRIATWRVPTT